VKEILVNNPRNINDERVQEHPDESGQKNTDEILEIAGDELEQVSGGGDGTAVGLA
jgi:hypothetical protein